MSSAGFIIAAMLAQGMIALALLGLLGVQRLPLVAEGTAKIRDVALDDRNWPKQAVQTSNAFNNQFQLPVLFYVACTIALYLGATWWTAALAGLFVVSRIGHAVVFASSNHVPTRFKFYVSGLALLCLLWLVLIIQLATTMIGQ